MTSNTTSIFDFNFSQAEISFYTGFTLQKAKRKKKRKKKNKQQQLDQPERPTFLNLSCQNEVQSSSAFGLLPSRHISQHNNQYQYQNSKNNSYHHKNHNHNYHNNHNHHYHNHHHHHHHQPRNRPSTHSCDLLVILDICGNNVLQNPKLYAANTCNHRNITKTTLASSDQSYSIRMDEFLSMLKP